MCQNKWWLLKCYRLSVPEKVVDFWLDFTFNSLSWIILFQILYIWRSVLKCAAQMKHKYISAWPNRCDVFLHLVEWDDLLRCYFERKGDFFYLNIKYFILLFHLFLRFDYFSYVELKWVMVLLSIPKLPWKRKEVS